MEGPQQKQILVEMWVFIICLFCFYLHSVHAFSGLLLRKYLVIIADINDYCLFVLLVWRNTVWPCGVQHSGLCAWVICPVPRADQLCLWVCFVDRQHPVTCLKWPIRLLWSWCSYVFKIYLNQTVWMCKYQVFPRFSTQIHGRWSRKL